MLVYWESMVWRIIANRIVYYMLNTKNAYKLNLMVLNGQLFPASPHVGAAMIQVLRQPMEECHLALCVYTSDVTARP